MKPAAASSLHDCREQKFRQSSSIIGSAFPFRTPPRDTLICFGQHLFRINELLTLDSPKNLDSNRIDSE